MKLSIDSTTPPARPPRLLAWVASLLVAGAVHGSPPAVDNASSDSDNNTDIISVSHATSGNSRLMLVGIGWDRQGVSGITSVKYNGTNLTFVGGHSSGSEVRVEIWRMVAPPVGTYNLVVDFNGDLEKGGTVGVMTFTGVDQATPLGTYSGNSGSGSNASTNVSSAVDELAFAVACNETQNMTEGSGTTEYWYASTGDSVCGGGTEAGAASVTVNWTLSSDAWAIGGVSIKPGGATISSAANQTFATGDPVTTISPITVTDATTVATVTAANDLRIRIPAGFAMGWNTADTTATIGGTAAGKVSSTVSYEDSGKTLVLDVTSSFSAGQTVIVSDLGFMNFTTITPVDNLELEVADDDVVTATDDKTIEIGGAVVTYRSIGTNGGTLYSTGDASTTAGSPIVTFAGGASLPANVGAGDKLTIGGGGPSTLFSDDFGDGSLSGWTKLSGDTLVESGGIMQTSSGDNASSRYSIDGGAAWADYTFSIDIRARDNDYSGIIFRVQDSSNYYRLRQEFGDGDWDLELDKVVGGSSSALASDIDNEGSSPGEVDDEDQWYEFKVELSGTNIKCSIDNVLKFDVNDSTFATGTAGIYLSSQQDGEFDNALVTGSAGSSESYILTRDSATQVTLEANASSTLSNKTYTIERAYNTLQAWEDDREGDLVTETRREVGVCYDDGAFTDRVVISGSTTSASFYMRLTVPAGERHDGTPGSGARIDGNGGWSSQNAIDVRDEYARVEWLEITDVNDAGNGIFFSASPAADNGLVQGVYVNGFLPNGNAAFHTEASGVTVRNSVATGPSRGVHVDATGGATIDNCTFWGAGAAGYGVHAVAGATIGVRNTIAVGYGTLDMDIDSGATITDFGYNMFRTWGGGFDPDADIGNNQWPPIDLDDLFVDSSSSNLHVEVSGNRAGNLGLDLSAVFADDVDGQVRTDSWDIGADEARPGTDLATPKLMVWHERER